jgi:hypothetical protein
MTAPDQCCINVKKLLSIRRRPHMTHRDIDGIEIRQRSDLLPHRLVAAKEIGSAYQDSEHFRSPPRTVTTSLWQLSLGLTDWADLAAVLLVGAHSTEEAPC